MSRAIAMLIMLISIISCSSYLQNDTPYVASAYSDNPFNSKNRYYPVEPPETGEPAMHAVQNSRLEAVMHQINNLVYDQLNNEIKLSREGEIKTAQIADIANQLANSEKFIVEILPSLKLKPDEASAFLALAGKLRAGALHLEELANQKQLQTIPATLDTITSTCISCHALFRKKPSLLEKCKDPKYTC
ncbi:MAG: hypothetical protein ACXWF8_11265 [Methylobacter sp.]